MSHNSLDLVRETMVNLTMFVVLLKVSIDLARERFYIDYDAIVIDYWSSVHSGLSERWPPASAATFKTSGAFHLNWPK